MYLLIFNCIYPIYSYNNMIFNLSHKKVLLADNEIF